MRLAPKLAGTPIILVVLIAAAGLSNAYFARRMRVEVEDNSARLQLVAGNIQHLTQLFSDVERDLYSHFWNPDPTAADRVRSRHREIDSVLKSISSQPWSPRQRALLEDLVRTQPKMASAQRAVLDINVPDMPPEKRAAFIQWWFIAQKAHAILADLSAYNLRSRDLALSSLRALRTRSNVSSVFLTLLAVIIAGVFALYVYRGVLRPVIALTRASQNLGVPSADPVPTFPERKDELGTLATTLSEMTARLTRSNGQLAEALTMRDQFLSIAAHELKTPLTSLTLQIHLLKKHLAAAPPTKLMAGMSRQVARLSELVNELLDVSRIQAGKLELHTEDIALAELVREVAGRFSSSWESRGKRLVLDLDESTVARVDTSRMDQVLVNLLGNATKYAPDSDVRIQLARQGKGFSLRVEDNGPGIPEEIRARLFEPYARPQGSRAEGLGLGLYLCKQMVEAHGGTIEVQTGVNAGTRFEIRIPAAPVLSRGESHVAG